MLDYIAYLLAQQRTADSSLDARPDSPVQPPEEDRRLARLNHDVRQRASRALRVLAEHVEPATDRTYIMREECR